MPCAAGLPKVHRHGRVPYDHPMVGAALVHADGRDVRPVLPAPRVHHAGTSPQDGARQAAKRGLTTWRTDPPPLQGRVTADRLSSHAPPRDTWPDPARPALLGVKEGAPAVLCQQVEAAEPAGRVSHDARHHRAAGLGPRWRVVHDGPRTASHADGQGHGIASWESGEDNVPPWSGVTDWRVNQRHVFHRRRGGRARWKLDHATCPTLPNHGDPCEQHSGHGLPQRSVMCALRMRLAFVVDQVPPRCGALCQAVGAKLGRTRLRWERLSAWCDDEARESMRPRLEALWYGVQKPPPIVMADASDVLP